MSGDLDAPCASGIGLHAGTAIVGEMGFDRTPHLTAIGDTVNTATCKPSLPRSVGAPGSARLGPGKRP
jgi:adenylate cyclase